MGGFQFKAFERNENIPGQGKSVQIFSRSLKISNYELDRMFNEFRRFEDIATNLVDIETMFAKCLCPYNVIERVIFQVYDDHKTGKLSFMEFLVLCFGFLASDDAILAITLFQLFDTFRANSVDLSEVKYMVNTIWNFKPSRSTNEALKKLEKNQDGVVALQEFVLLCNHHSDILSPLRKTRTQLRKKLIFRRFWTDMLRKRLEHFGTKSVFELRPDKRDMPFAATSLDYLNLQEGVVPNHFIEQWKLTQRRKQESYQGTIELPYELREELKRQEVSEDLELLRSQVNHSLNAKVKPRLGVYMEESYVL